MIIWDDSDIFFEREVSALGSLLTETRESRRFFLFLTMVIVV